MGAAGRALLLLTGGLCAGAVVAVAPDLAGATLLLLLPGLLLVLFDPTPGRAVGRAILLFEAAGCVQPVTVAWMDCEGLRQCAAMVTNARTLLSILLFAGAGLLLTLALPMAVTLIDTSRTERRLAELAAERRKLSDDWDLFD